MQAERHRRAVRTTRPPLVAAAALLLAVTLTACGSAGLGTVSKLEPAQQPQELLPQARQEGKVVWYTTFADSDVDDMISAFNKAYPGIKVEALRLSADKLPSRLVTEQRGRKFNADVISADSEPVYQLIKVNTLVPYQVPQAPPLPAQLRNLPAGYGNAVYILTSAIAYNPSGVKAQHLQPPTSIQDLTEPQWKGRFSIDPSAVNWYESLISSMGHDKALQLVKELGDNSPRLVESHTQSLTEVQSGEPLASVNAYAYKAASLAKKTPTRMAFTNTDPQPAAAALAEIARNAPHPAAAKLFMDWIMSAQGQDSVVKITNHTSLSPSAVNDTSVWNPAKWKPAWSMPVITADTYDRYLAEYQKALHAV
ncbi:ABC transporter substrate-binding protein [Actinacidiphila guanduensis]|jgi:iron(III) transport system substrate-binding protein|uniref:Iron(III) transport system substrate-binding protein n=1 Tax=Actinacidiphila guanduensis TaxID=310781 RepID=A0A1G9VG77_9ACTN|nr:extracellular solute-binding protein [Actinacidiphila guanduensis]SDM70835.1 iron(III) transport system substrate-binding protein [Actinacidiphila guanduensis]